MMQPYMIPLDRSIEKLADLPWYTEGPVVDEHGNIYCTTLGGSSILKIDSNGNLSHWAKSKCPNGQVILPGGDHLICESGLAAISRFNREGKFIGHDMEGFCNGQQIYAPNDLAVDAEGGIYFTDSIRYYGKVCYYTPGGSERIIATNLDFPNGIALSKDGRMLFIAESYQNRILMIALNSDGEPEDDWSVFAVLPYHPSGDVVKNLPDGIKIDDEGCMWIAHYGMQCVQVLSPEGQLINCIKTEFPLVSNLYLKGKEVIVTGGYAEPGPGGLLKIIL